LLMRLLALLTFSSCAALRLAPLAGARRCASPSMGVFDGVKDAFSSGEKPLVGGDRVTPFDRWLGLDQGLTAEDEQVDKTVTFIDPNDAANYMTLSLAKPMGIAFVENAGNDLGLVVDEVLPTGSAAASATPVLPGDQLVAVDGDLVLGAEFDAGLDKIKASPGDTVSLVFFRGPTAFLYGPTKPTEDWYRSNLL